MSPDLSSVDASQYNHFKYLYLNSLLNIDLIMFIELKCSRYVNIAI